MRGCVVEYIGTVLLVMWIVLSITNHSTKEKYCVPGWKDWLSGKLRACNLFAKKLICRKEFEERGALLLFVSEMDSLVMI